MSDIINLYMNDSWRGPGKVVSNLKKGLQQLNIDVNINPPIDHITLRDFFAAAALTGLLADGDRKSAVENAYAIADKMLLERDDDPA